MEFDNSSPIWNQLLQEFSRRIVTGAWTPGERLPGVRELAAELGVNPNTVQRALGELDRAALTLTERTSGRFVTEDRDTIAAAREELATAATDHYIDSVAGIGLDLTEATQLIARRWAAREETP